jgi:plasmid stability protein
VIYIGSIQIRNLPDDVVLHLSELAKKQKISREQYVRELLISFASSEVEQELHNKYDTIIQQLIEILQEQNEIIERNTLAFDTVIDMVQTIINPINSENF